MTINAISIARAIRPYVDGIRYGALPAGGFSTITANLAAYGWGQAVTHGGTITGPAPLAVFCECVNAANSDSSVDTFREQGYHFDFGYATPATPGSWTHSSQPKGKQVGGPVAAHVYETAGTYTLSARAQDANFHKADEAVTIVVVDAETYWTTGGRTTTNIPVSDGAWPTWASNKRYTLDAGGDYSTFGTIQPRNLTNICVAKTGTGADPIVAQVSTDNDATVSTNHTGARAIFMNLNASGQPLSNGVQGEDVLYYKCSGRVLTVGTSTRGRYTAYPSVAWKRPTRIAYYECSFDQNENGIPFVTQAWQFMMLGCTLIDSEEHNLRVQGAQYAFVGHNRMYDPGITAGNKHCLTFRATGISDLGQYITASTEMPASRYIVAADNYLASTTDTGTWPLYIGPQNATTVESLEHVIAERTRYANRAAYSNDWAHTRGCRKITIRDEVYDSGASNGVGAEINYGVNSAEWINGPWWSTNWDGTIDGTYRKSAPASIIPDKAGT